MTVYTPGTLVTTRARDWVVLPESTSEMLVLRPLGGSDDDIAAVFPDLEPGGVAEATFAPPTPGDLGDAASAGLLRTAMRVGFRSSAGPFRALAGLAVDPRAYQLVPLLMALRQETARLLIADDVGVGKTVEAGLIATELLASGEASGLAVLCSPALAEQWQDELRQKFNIDTELVLASTVNRLRRTLDLGQTIFQKYRHVVVSTDLIKNPKYRAEFLKNCPDLVIVDEAHGCVASDDDKSTQRNQLRYELLQQVAADTGRHLLLLTATPHSGKSAAFRNLLGLLHPRLSNVDIDTDAGRRLLAEYFVQRKRADIRHYLDEDTEFPADRLFKDETYKLTPGYRALLDAAIDHARGKVTGARGRADRRSERIAWWSAIALLRSLVSSPRAAELTLRTRSAAAMAETAEEADLLGRPITLDSVDDDRLEGIDLAPGADYDEAAAEVLKQLADQAAALEGPDADAKLAALIKHVKRLLAEGYSPIVFCHYIPTAEYVAEHLREALPGKVLVEAVTGTLSPQQRLQRIADLATASMENPSARKVLVATDCLSEGVNLQHHFDAVVHYDLAWNPTRHDQREGRVDRFGQTRDQVKVVTVYGADNGIDGKVLDVLITKHRRIRKELGISVSVPDEASAGVTDAIVEWLVLTDRDDRADQPGLFELADVEQTLDKEWQSAADREKRTRARYAQNAIKPDEVKTEIDTVRDVLGAAADVDLFTRRALRAYGGLITDTPEGFTADVTTTPVGLRDTLGTALGGDTIDKGKPVVFRVNPAVPRGEAALVRTDPAISALAAYTLDTALDKDLPSNERPARRTGVMRTDAVSVRTTLLLARFRFQLVLPSRHGVRDLVAEDVRLLAFTGSPDRAVWLDHGDTLKLLNAEPKANVDRSFAENSVARILDTRDALDEHLAETADRLAEELYSAHRRVREVGGAGQRRLGGLRVTPQGTADLLGVYVYLPVSPGGA
ncbi:DEAD/DEAH box helicase [Phytomonospora endophytica]|uniref:Superfamily II DNA or RNA helicase n=1 Tax=Phytomonospora endophytica TaxID=714109 RepID=A0A841F7C7_9ACTN|nr:DEAD/DEAH box helicase [Phytomonospora endophytica]MBB6032921.1 superfamily II DNA or RNA helicase [Phytomonospora endophytica]GIG65148.1 ATP-dependent helicase HepA [Phytomonospora endophytica]